MNNLFIVTQREFFTRIKKPSFIILTVLMPFLMAGVVMVPVLFSMIKDDTKKEVVIIDNTGKYLPLFINAQTADSTASDTYTFLPATEKLETYRTTETDVQSVISITDDLTEHPEACRIYSKGEVQQDLQNYVENILSDQIRRDKLSSYNIPQLDKIIDDVQTSFNVKTIKWSEDGNESFSSGDIAIVLGMMSAMLIYMFVMIYGAMVMQSVMEEKTNRIVEVIVGSVKPFHLMLGKILGVMLVGFTQILIWGIMLTGIMTWVGFAFGSAVDTSSIQQAAMAGQMAAQQMPPMGEGDEIISAILNLPLFEVGIFFVLYFLGGYILYSSFYAAVGASVNSQEDSSQFMMPMIIIMVVALYGAMGSLENTDGPLAFWASLFPLTSPIVMMVRIPFGVPLWQELLSVVLLYATALGFVWIGGRIYRIGILMYGKKPTFAEMFKWLRYK